MTPEAVGLADVAVESIMTPDNERVVLWYSPAPPDRPTILFFHGNASEIGHRHERFAFYRSKGFGVAFLSYRGYGGSTGSPSETGLITDAIAAYDWLAARNIPSRRILLVGESLGTGVAVQLAARRRVAALALEAPFSSAADVGAYHYWWLPVRLLMKDQFRSSNVIGKIDAPIIVFHGERDEVIPYDLGQALFAAANEPKEFVTIPGGDHYAIFDEAIWGREADFFPRALASENRRSFRAAAAN
jgi:fermentation-respiration switch protein FrsA (DUF1100 family)